MKVFLWTIVGLGIVELVGGIYHAVRGEVPERTAFGMAFNTAFWTVFAMWAYWLLVSQ